MLVERPPLRVVLWVPRPPGLCLPLPPAQPLGHRASAQRNLPRHHVRPGTGTPPVAGPLEAQAPRSLTEPGRGVPLPAATGVGPGLRKGTGWWRLGSRGGSPRPRL